MAVQLETLYSKIDPAFEVQLLTKSCFNKMIQWIHMVEDMDFIPLLHGDELVFNSGLNYSSEQWLQEYVEALNKKRAGGLILSMRDGMSIPKYIIDYCNEIEFALFSATWRTPFIDIMRIFSEILLQNEQRETNLTSALKNAIYFPDNEELYQSHFERNDFFKQMDYNVIILSCDAYRTEHGNEKLDVIQRRLRYGLERKIICEENGRLLILVANYPEERIVEESRKLCKKDPNIYIGIGTTVHNMRDIHKSYMRAFTAYQLTKTAIAKNVLCYPELGIYKLLADRKEEEIYPEFVEEVLGPVLAYDKEHGTNYLHILEIYFENDCSIIHTAEKLYCHKNTMTYKINKIKEIVGYAILTNENRMKIMVALKILKIGT